jgi:hypothetical protein
MPPQPPDKMPSPKGLRQGTPDVKPVERSCDLGEFAAAVRPA